MRTITTVTVGSEYGIIAKIAATLHGEGVGQFVERAILERAQNLLKGKEIDRGLAEGMQRLREEGERDGRARP